MLPGGNGTDIAGWEDRSVVLGGTRYMATRADFVVRLDGRTCLQLWNLAGGVVRLEGDPLQAAQWFAFCKRAGLTVRTQVNESHTPEEGVPVPAYDPLHDSVGAHSDGDDSAEKR